MNISTKCNCCIKEDVCRFKEDYIRDRNNILGSIEKEEITEVSIKCKKFSAMQNTRIKQLDRQINNT